MQTWEEHADSNRSSGSNSIEMIYETICHILTVSCCIIYCGNLKNNHQYSVSFLTYRFLAKAIKSLSIILNETVECPINYEDQVSAVLCLRIDMRGQMAHFV